MLSTAEAILLTGATAQVGVFALPALLAADYPVLALSRKVLASPGLSIAPGQSTTPGAGSVQWLHPDTVWQSDASRPEECLNEAGVLLSCGPVEVAARMVPVCSNLRRVVCISTSSVYTKQSSPDAAERLLIDRIKTAEHNLSRSCRDRGITLMLLRPTLIYGCGLDQNVSRVARLIHRFRFFPLAGDASGLRQPVHAADLAALAVALIQAKDLQNFESPVGGGSVLSYRQMVEQVFATYGLAPRTLSIAPSVLVALLKTFSWLPALQGVNAGFFLRQNLDQVFDDGNLRKLVNFNPRPFRPTVADFSVPDRARALQPAQVN